MGDFPGLAPPTCYSGPHSLAEMCRGLRSGRGLAPVARTFDHSQMVAAAGKFPAGKDAEIPPAAGCPGYHHMKYSLGNCTRSRVQQRSHLVDLKGGEILKSTGR